MIHFWVFVIHAVFVQGEKLFFFLVVVVIAVVVKNEKLCNETANGNKESFPAICSFAYKYMVQVQYQGEHH